MRVGFFMKLKDYKEYGWPYIYQRRFGKKDN